MNKINFLTLILLSLGMAACSSPKYQKANKSQSSKERGYMDKKIKPNTYLVEYAWRGGLSWITSCDKNVAKLENYWNKRATELCPCGYEGQPSFLRADEAKFPEFNSSKKEYRAEPIASGEVVCKACNSSGTPTAQ